MSGLLGNILGSLLGGSQPGANQSGGTQTGGVGGLAALGGAAGISALLIQVINAAGGPAGILEKFHQAGLGSQAQSWVGQGENQTLSPEHVQSVFSNQQIETWAQQHGVSTDVVTQALAHFLPHAVDAQTPNGTVPPNGTAQADPSNVDFDALIGRLTGHG